MTDQNKIELIETLKSLREKMLIGSGWSDKAIEATPVFIANHMLATAHRIIAALPSDNASSTVHEELNPAVSQSREPITHDTSDNGATDDELVEAYINGITRISNYRPPASCAHDGANTLNEIRAFADKEIEAAKASTIRNRPVKEGGDLVGAVELLGEITADYDNANDLSIIRHCGNYAMKAGEAIDLIKSHLKLRNRPVKAGHENNL